MYSNKYSIEKNALEELYKTRGKSAMEIAKLYGCSANKISYWLKKYFIKKRTISDAIYLRHNPDGDPFVVHPVKADGDAFLFGLGLGLYWGEGNRRNKASIRIGNTDSALIKSFIAFLEKLYKVRRSKLKFGLQVFSDIDPEHALRFWCKKLRIMRSQFCKVTITRSGKVGTYREKSAYGVLTLYFHNIKLRNILIKEIEKLRKMY